MKHSAQYALISLSLAAPALSVAAPVAKKMPAERRLMTLDAHTTQHFRPSSSNGFVVIALSDSSLLINNQATALRAGESRQVRGEHMLDIINTAELPAALVVVKIDTAFQNLTISEERLDPRQTFEDASDRNDTLVVALTPMSLRDLRDLSAEDEHWKSSAPRTISLQKGQSAWLASGMHRVLNVGSTGARFITIEW
jgi:hypothetical protein